MTEEAKAAMVALERRLRVMRDDAEAKTRRNLQMDLECCIALLGMVKRGSDDDK